MSSLSNLMNCKLSLSQLLSGTAVVLISSAGAATTVTYDFSSQASGDLFESDVVGWSQDTPNPSAFGTTLPFAYIASTNFGGGATNTGHLGTQFANTDDNSTTTVTGNLDFTGVDEALPQVSLNLAILDNDLDQFTGRDGFRVAINSTTGSTLAELGFTPTAGDVSSWDVSVGVNGAPTSTTAITVTSSAGYIFKVNFGSAVTTFLYGDSQGGLADVQFASQAPIGTSNMGAIAMTHLPLAPVGESATTLVFDNIVASIPEPSGPALLLLGSAFLFGRRRS
ncbi:MAG: hypothetical protein ACJAVK_000176 [Akkermansiaceae bacterium]|jgi:hypothetical protein